jgi:hypothetical protein
MTNAAALFTAKTPPGLFAAPAPSVSAPLGSTEGRGAISGGLLRPGSIDQTTFLQMLQQQQQNRQAGGVGGKAVSMPVQGFQPASSAPSIPTLSSAQFAALVGAQNADPGLAAAPVEGPAGDPQAMAAAQQSQAQFQVQTRTAAPMTPAMKLSGTANRNTSANPQSGNPQSGGPASAGNADEEAPTISRKSNPQQMAAADSAPPADDMPTITRKSAPALEASASASTEQPAESESETASKSDPNVVHLKSPPDKDQQKELRMRNKRWVVDETPGARQLFFGADGKFGWDDFLDMINPLQHIPGIAQIYRAVTGDEINGAASLLGAIPFGPLGGVGLIASIADLAVKDVTGADIGGNLQAMIFGKDEAPEGSTASPADMAQAGASGNVTVQAAARETAYALSDASEMHSSCRG